MDIDFQAIIDAAQRALAESGTSWYEDRELEGILMWGGIPEAMASADAGLVSLLTPKVVIELVTRAAQQ